MRKDFMEKSEAGKRFQDGNRKRKRRFRVGKNGMEKCWNMKKLGSGNIEMEKKKELKLKMLKIPIWKFWGIEKNQI